MVALVKQFDDRPIGQLFSIGDGKSLYRKTADGEYENINTKDLHVNREGPINVHDFKLMPGDIVEVHGWCMLKHLEPGKYRIAKVGLEYGNTVYSFSKPKGTKILFRHYTTNVDPWLRDADNPDLNKIVKTPA